MKELNPAHRHSQAKCNLVQTSYIKRHIINILLTELSRSVWNDLDLGRVYRPHCVRSVFAISVKILPYRPPFWLIRTKHLLKRILKAVQSVSCTGYSFKCGSKILVRLIRTKYFQFIYKILTQNYIRRKISS